MMKKALLILISLELLSSTIGRQSFSAGGCTYVASADINISGIIDKDYRATWTSDDLYEQIYIDGRTSFDHRWLIDCGRAGGVKSLHVEAHINFDLRSTTFFCGMQ